MVAISDYGGISVGTLFGFTEAYPRSFLIAVSYYLDSSDEFVSLSYFTP
jgi:hypothetical protein